MSRLPRGWASASVGALVALNPKNECTDETLAGFVPMPLLGTSYRSSVAYESRPWREIKKGYTHFADGDVLLAKITPCFENGKAGLVTGLPNGIGSGSTEYFVCRAVNDALDARYLLALFKTQEFLTVGASQMTGSVGHKRVPKDYLLDTQIPLAPRNEQTRIADKLDKLLARVDACRNRLDRIPAILKRFRQAVLAAATSGALTEDWRPDSPRCDAPVQLGKVLTFVRTGPFGSALHQSDYVTGGTPLVNPMHIQRGEIVPSPDMTVGGETRDRLADFRMNVGDVVIARRGQMGRCAVVTETEAGWICGTGSMVLTPASELSPSFLQLFLSSPAAVSALEAGSVGSTMVNLNQKILLSLDIRVPVIAEQHEIVRRVEALFAFADRLEARYAAARAQVDKLTPALLAKAFRGELVPQDPNDEPASALLARIAATRDAAGSTRRPRTKSTARQEPSAP